MAPSISIMAVCGAILLALTLPAAGVRWKVCSMNKAKTTSQARRRPTRQRRAVRCSLMAASASFSSVARSQLLELGRPGSGGG